MSLSGSSTSSSTTPTNDIPMESDDSISRIRASSRNSPVKWSSNSKTPKEKPEGPSPKRKVLKKKRACQSNSDDSFSSVKTKKIAERAASPQHENFPPLPTPGPSSSGPSSSGTSEEDPKIRPSSPARQAPAEITPSAAPQTQQEKPTQ
ncbi:putative protein TPRXL [Sitophilus oryzae]|uniref:Uncharacterized protein n=1 Tax=Sitophilus oryzae TaxID=7048 RepID=A0A6J2XN74_SITOR|nr:putative protein TPRXL [Sitophilus oryzae]